eukprot:1159764-Pelagomonas_calceolata.AAC.6
MHRLTARKELAELAEIMAACKELAERNEGLSAIIAGNKAIMHAKDHEMGLLHVRLAEQLTMLDLAFSRRDVEIKRTADLEAVLVGVQGYSVHAETMDLLVSEGQNSLDQWANLNAEQCVPGSLSVMELRLSLRTSLPTSLCACAWMLQTLECITCNPVPMM